MKENVTFLIVWIEKNGIPNVLEEYVEDTILKYKANLFVFILSLFFFGNLIPIIKIH